MQIFLSAVTSTLSRPWGKQKETELKIQIHLQRNEENEKKAPILKIQMYLSLLHVYQTLHSNWPQPLLLSIVASWEEQSLVARM